MFGKQCPDYIQPKKKIQQLQAENARLRDELATLALYKNLAAQYGLEAFSDLESLQKDAERYRWLRDTQEGKTVRIMYRREWDKAIDEAIRKEKTE